MEAGQGVMMQVIIKELDVTDLDPVHWFGKKNSPVVSGACGRWAETTKVSPNAGESAYWVGLDWKFLMDDKLHRTIRGWERRKSHRKQSNAVRRSFV